MLMRLIVCLFSIALFAANESVLLLPTVKVRGKRPALERPVDSGEFSGQRIPIPSTSQASWEEIVTATPSLSVKTVGGENGDPQFLLRGHEASQSRYFLEGIPLTDAEFNAWNVSLLPMDAVESLEIHPEGIPVPFATDGLGGAIHFRLKDPMILSKTQVVARVGSFSSYKAVAGGNVLPRTSAWLEYRQARDDFSYRHDNGTPFNPDDDFTAKRDHNGFRRVNLVSNTNLYHAPSSDLQWVTLSSLGQSEISGPILQPTHGDLSQGYHLNGLRWLQTKDGEFDAEYLGSFRIDARDLRPGDRSLAPVFPSGWSLSTAVGLRGRKRFVFGEGRDSIDFILASNFDRYQVRSDRLGSLSGVGSRLDVPLGATGVFSMSDQWVLKPALMIHTFGYDHEFGPAKRFVFASPRMGLFWTPQRGSQVRTALGAYYRAPTLFELYGYPSGVTGNSELRAERAYRGELGADWETRIDSPVVREISASWTSSLERASDLVSYIQNSQSTKMAINIGESVLQSHEVAVQARFGFLPVDWKAGVAFLPTTNLSPIAGDNGKRLPGRSEYRFENVLGVAAGPWRLRYRTALYGPTYWDTGNFKKMASFWDHSAQAAWESRVFGSFALDLLNLTDTNTVVSETAGFPSTDNTTGYLGFPAPGRRVYLSWRYDW